MVHARARLDPSAHFGQPWRIHAIAKDFRLEDVWALPARGGPDDFPRLISLFQSLDPSDSSPLVRALFAVRWRLGGWLGMDRPDAGVDARVESLRTRLPDDLLGDTGLGIPETLPFRPVYVTEREAAFEIANTTMHGVMHLGWVPDGAGGYHGQMAVLVKPNGLLGRAYMTAIAPFRHVVVYPQMLGLISRRWRGGARPIAVPEGLRGRSTLFFLGPDGLVFATFVHHHTPATRALWAAVQRIHMRTVLELLDRAVRAPVAATLNAGN